jgi:hypothetical protein
MTKQATKHLQNISQALVRIDPKISLFNYIMGEVAKLAELSGNEEQDDKSK